MKKEILFKVIQRKLKFRNPQHLLALPPDFIYSEEEYISARDYILSLAAHRIAYCYPGHENYPQAFLKMKEPPLFFEYCGLPLWNRGAFIAVVGSREVSEWSERWMKNHLDAFLRKNRSGLVSGGAKGVDQLAHLIAIKNKTPTIVILPSGLLHLYPRSLEELRRLYSDQALCFISEFELSHKIHKSHFYFRNRLIAALGRATLVVQASQKSGSLLTVHHALEAGRPVLTVPAHPEMSGFDGNLKLLQDGAGIIRDFQDLHDFWGAEFWPN